MLDLKSPRPAAAFPTEATSKALKEAARTLGLDIVFFNATTADEIDTAFAAFARERLDALFIAGDGFFVSRSVQFATLAVRERIPASFSTRVLVEAGLLMCYGADIVDTFRQVGVYTGSILKGAKPADLPVLQSTKFEFVINQQTAKSLGLDRSADAARPRRRGDRITAAFAALHIAANGTLLPDAKAASCPQLAEGDIGGAGRQVRV